MRKVEHPHMLNGLGMQWSSPPSSVDGGNAAHDRERSGRLESSRPLVQCWSARLRRSARMGGDHFIQVREADVVSKCAAELPPAESEAFLAFASVLARLQHQQFYERIEVVKGAWSVLKPQTDTSSPVRVTSEERLAARQRLEEELAELARAAKFVGVEESVLDRAFRDHSLLKVRM